MTPKSSGLCPISGSRCRGLPSPLIHVPLEALCARKKSKQEKLRPAEQGPLRYVGYGPTSGSPAAVYAGDRTDGEARARTVHGLLVISRPVPPF